ncbi:hypothetical protein [Methanofervidicoccus sp. A16]|uniref:hypothetical protein n=1 Tax=Methanofervidicoccus sp. A16 TaxID=2607662 RepID=UPI0012372E6D|nr:hypothetical protein [Methanofervidicoccus sp. A16]
MGGSDKMNVEVDIVSIKYKNERIDLTDNPYPSLKNLEKYLDLIIELCKGVYKNNNLIGRKEFENLLYYSFLYYLVNWDNIYHSNQVPYINWYNFKNSIDNILKNRESIEVFLDYKYLNIEIFEEYLKEIYSIKIKRKNKNILIDYFIKHYHGSLIYLMFLIRKMLMNKNINENFSVLFSTDYNRYFLNKRFFGTHLFNYEPFKKLVRDLGIEDFNYKILYTKYNPFNLKDYLLNFYKKEKEELFIEEILDLKIGLNLILNINKIYRKNIDFNIEKEDFNKYFIYRMFKIFVKHKLPFILWIYLSVKEFIKNTNIKVFIGDSEKSFMSHIFNLYKINEGMIKTVVFSHELINKNYAVIPVSNKNRLIPDLKLVWNENIKKLLIQRYNYPPEKVLVFPDPRFLYWRGMPKREKTILLISQGSPIFYEQVFELSKEGVLNNLGYKVLFKPHPGEYYISKSYIEKLKNLKGIKVIDNLNFIPEYAVTMTSTLGYELLNAGSKVYFIDEKAREIFLIDDKLFKKIYRRNLKEVFCEILDTNHYINA